jgi:hypothetical protein
MVQSKNRLLVKGVLACVFMLAWGSIVFVQFVWHISGPTISWIFSLAAAVSGAFSAFALKAIEEDSRARVEQKIEQFEIKAAQEPEKTKLAWDLARVKLEAYFDRNLSQVRMIFFVAMFVMVVGFIFVLSGISIAFHKPESMRPSYISSISGIITQFIGLTFMLIYRSTMAQANQFMEVLERINAVGMAVQILDTIPEGEVQLKNSTRAQIAALLLSPAAKSVSRTRRSGAVRNEALQI